ncbi:hypothetical protein BGC30_12775 [Novacetimonas hansenii]|nr:hypothetical protein BGC30_12775 [Novacetimonas hansenii]
MPAGVAHRGPKGPRPRHMTDNQPLHFFFLTKKKTRPAMAPSARIPLRQGDLDGHFVVHSDMGRFP